ncbi:MAG: thioredoxin [Candidatus Aminicenantes bacterium]|nr:thioredoxin [Candidatus Aminicenantes bacterium]
MKHVAEVTDQTFEIEVLKSDLPVLVDFWAPWCGPCRMMAPILEAAAEKMAGRVKFAKLDTDEGNGLAHKLGIMAIPTLILFVKGAEKDRFVGLIPQAQLEAKLEAELAALAPPASPAAN